MKWTLTLLFLFVVKAVLAITLSNDWVLENFESSYASNPFHYHEDCLMAGIHSLYPNTPGLWEPATRSGGSIQEANENRLEREGLSAWARHAQRWGITADDGNGSFTQTDFTNQLLFTMAAPGLLFNGTAYTNEGGVSQTFSIHWIGQGPIPQDQADGQTIYRDRDGWITNFFGAAGLPYVEEWWALWNAGWSNDVNSGANLIRWFPSSHPGPPGQLNMTINRAVQLGFPTNISAMTFNFIAGTVSATNACAIASVSRSGNTLTFNYKLDRMAFGWDIPDGTITNDASDFSKIIPSQGNAFTEILQVTNLPAGLYQWNLDGSNVIVLSSAQLATGWNRFTNYSGAEWAQKKEILGRCRDLIGCDRVTLADHSAGQNGPFGPDIVNKESNAQSFWNAGDRGDTLVADLAPFEASIENNYNARIIAAAVQTNHTATLTLIQPGSGNLNVGNLNVGTLTIGP